MTDEMMTLRALVEKALTLLFCARRSALPPKARRQDWRRAWGTLVWPTRSSQRLSRGLPSALRKPSPSGPIFLRKLRCRSLRGVKLIISDAHEGINAAAAKMMHTTWQRCRVHFMCIAHAGKSGRPVVSAFIATAFAQNDVEAVRTQWRKVVNQLRQTLPKLAASWMSPKKMCSHT